MLGDWAAPRGGRRPHWAELEVALKFWLVLEAVPRIIRCREERPTLIFTDGACEGVGRELVTVGGLLISPELERPRFFGFEVEQEIVSLWRLGGKRQVIAEIYPAVVAKRLWRLHVKNKRVIHFIDNESARVAFIKGYSPVMESAAMLADFWALESKLGSYSWFERVPSAASPADGPSRLDFGAVLGAGAVQDFPSETERAGSRSCSGRVPPGRGPGLC